MHLALLVCDTPRPAVVEKYGDYPTMFTRLFKNSGADVTWEAFDVVHKQEYPDGCDHFDGIVISGSAASAYENEPWILKLVEFVQSVRHHGPKLIGICFGHQIISRACGAACTKNPNGWEFGSFYIKLTPFAKTVFGTDKECLLINQVHQDHVPEAPEGFKVLGTTSPHTPVHALLSDDGRCFSVQGHPEMNRDTVRILLQLRKEAGVVPADYADTQLAELDRLDREGVSADDIWITRQIVRFIQGQVKIDA